MDTIASNDSLVEEYIGEVTDLLEELNDSLIEFEKSPEDLSLVNSLFRGCHTIKGVSAMFGHFSVSELVHKMENLLDGVRKGERNVDQPIINVLFEGLDRTQKIIQEISSGQEEISDTTELQNKIESIRFGEAGPSLAAVNTKGSVEDIEGLPENLVPHVDGYVLSRIFEAITGEQNIFLLRLRFPLTDEVDFHELFECVSMAGEPLVNIPCFDEIMSLDDFSEDDCFLSYKYLLVSKEEKSTIRQVINSLSGINDIDFEDLHLFIKQSSKLLGDEACESVPAQYSVVKVRPELFLEINQLLDEHQKTTSDLERLGMLLSQQQGLKNDPQFQELERAVQNTVHVGLKFRETVFEMQKVPMDSVFKRFKRLIRDLMAATGKNFRLETTGDAVQIDKSIADGLHAPLMHLVRNAADHGMESMEERKAAGKPMQGCISLVAFFKEQHLVIRVEDDGYGLSREKILQKAVENDLVDADASDKLSDEEVFSLIMKPGFSTAQEVTDLSGRGVGMDVVDDFVRNNNGSISVQSQKGKGSRIEITLPLSQAAASTMQAQAVIVRSQGVLLAVPEEIFLEELHIPAPDYPSNGSSYIDQKNDRNVTIIDLNGEEAETNEVDGNVHVVVLKMDKELVGFPVEEIVASQEVMMENMGVSNELPYWSESVSVLENGDKVPLLDISKLILHLKNIRDEIELRASE